MFVENPTAPTPLRPPPRGHNIQIPSCMRAMGTLKYPIPHITFTYTVLCILYYLPSHGNAECTPRIHLERIMGAPVHLSSQRPQTKAAVELSLTLSQTAVLNSALMSDHPLCKQPPQQQQQKHSFPCYEPLSSHAICD